MANEEVLFEQVGAVARIKLNRPAALHALNYEMCRDTLHKLGQWQSDKTVSLIMLEHATGRGFCAGGDVKRLHESVQSGNLYARTFFFTEYQLNHQLFYSNTTTLVFMDGITMGGGVGLAMPCKYRIATENTRFAMPETGIGLFPDVGGGWYLSRLAHHLGTYMALTGEPVKGENCLSAGLATHFVPSTELEKVKKQILNAPDSIDEILLPYRQVTPNSEFAELQECVETCFAELDLSTILHQLKNKDDDWAASTMRTLERKSPYATAITLELLRRGRAAKSFTEEMKREFSLAVKVTKAPDFSEGVRALLIDKDNTPDWQPDSIAKISDTDIASAFTIHEKEQQWEPKRFARVELE